MDVSYAQSPRVWELSDSPSSSDGEPAPSSRPGSVHTLSSSDREPATPTGPSTADSVCPDELHSAHSDPGLLLPPSQLDLDLDPLSFDTKSRMTGCDRSGSQDFGDGDGDVSESDSGSYGSLTGGLFVPFREGLSDWDTEGKDTTDEGRPDSPGGQIGAPSGGSRSSRSTASSSKAVLTSLRKSWKKVKKTGARGTSSASKSLSSISSAYFNSSRVESTRETREERHSRLGDEWLTSILPSWRKKKKTARVRTLVFRGIPANVRGKAWQCAIGNPLNVSEELFEVLKERAHAGRMEYIRGRETVALADGDVGGNGGRAEGMMEHERSAHKAIMLDLPRTFPELTFFHAEGSHYEYALRDVLEAFLYLKPDVGYSQGMSFLAAVLLLYMDPYDAFSCFVNMLLHKSCFLHFFKIKMPEVRFYLTVHERLLSEEIPSLHCHFKEQGIESDLYMINWVMSLYCRALPLDLVTRIWDIYVLDGDIAIFRAALGILRFFANRLLKMKFEELAYFLSHIPAEEIQADALLHSIRAVRVVTRKRFRDLFKECEMEQNKIDEKPTDSELDSKGRRGDKR